MLNANVDKKLEWRKFEFESANLLSEQFVKARMTIGFIARFFECALVQLLQTESAYKMLRMEFTEHGCDAAAGDWFGAASTQWTSFGMIMCLTIWQSFEVEEGTMLKWLTTVL